MLQCYVFIVALRMVKALFSFDLSGCLRVKYIKKNAVKPV